MKTIATDLRNLKAAVKEHKKGKKAEAKPKPLTLNMIRTWDLRYGTSYLRMLEMDVDYVTGGNGYCMQFMGDLVIYGLDEALKLLEQRFKGKRDYCGGLAGLEKTVKLIQKRVKR